MRRDLILLFASLLSLTLSLSAKATGVESAQLHARLGYVGGTYDGPLSGTFTSPAMDFEYEVFKTNSFAYAFRSMLALEMPMAKPHYTYFGVGGRWYLGSHGPMTDEKDSRISLVTRPTWRYYLGADFGVSQVIIQTFGNVLQIVSSMVELGAAAGTIYQFNDVFGVEARLAGTVGFGFTSVALTGATYVGTLGVVFYY